MEMCKIMSGIGIDRSFPHGRDNKKQEGIGLRRQ